MTELDHLLDNYEALAEAARRLERSRGNHEGEHEFCRVKGRCVKCEEASIQAETHLHRALLELGPRPFSKDSDWRFPSGPEMQCNSAPTMESAIGSSHSATAKREVSMSTRVTLKHFDKGTRIGMRGFLLYREGP